MIAFERRQRLLRLLREEPGIRVPAMAQVLGVTEATIRSDLAVLEQEQRLRRVRGGAVPLNGGPDVVMSPPAFDRNGDPKGIGRWVAELVEDGDTILIDESALAFSLAAALAERQNLTIVTNGVDAARLLAANPSNRVVLIGGLMRPDGRATGGLVGAAMLEDIHMRMAFVSGDGFSTTSGLMDSDLHTVQLKRAMLAGAARVVVMISANRLGRTGLSAVVPTENVAHLFTDNDATPEQVEELRRLPLTLTICGENTVTSFTPHSTLPVYKLAFANLSEAIPFAVDVRRGLERAAKEVSNIDLVIADNRLDPERALQIADNFVTKGVDLVVEYQIDAGIGPLLMSKYQRAGLPVIAVDIPMVGATYFGVDNFLSGHMAGVALGQWIERAWNGRFDTLLILAEPRAGSLPQARIEGQIRGLEEILGPVTDSRRIVLNSGNTSSASEAEVDRALRELPTDARVAAVCFNDDAALGALRAAQKLERIAHFALVGQGADRILRDEIRRAGSHVVGSTAFMPERYGERLIELALRVLRGAPVPPAVYMDHVFIDAANVDEVYPVV